MLFIRFALYPSTQIHAILRLWTCLLSIHPRSQTLIEPVVKHLAVPSFPALSPITFSSFSSASSLPLSLSLSLSLNQSNFLYCFKSDPPCLYPSTQIFEILRPRIYSLSMHPPRSLTLTEPVVDPAPKRYPAFASVSILKRHPHPHSTVTTTFFSRPYLLSFFLILALSLSVFVYSSLNQSLPQSITLQLTHSVSAHSHTDTVVPAGMLNEDPPRGRTRTRGRPPAPALNGRQPPSFPALISYHFFFFFFLLYLSFCIPL